MNYTFKVNAKGVAVDGKRAFSVVIPYVEAMEPLPATLRFPVVPGLVHGLAFTVPESVRGKTMLVGTHVDAAAVKKHSFKVTSLQKKEKVPQTPHPCT